MVGGMAEPNIPAEATARLRANERVLPRGGLVGRRRPALLPGAPSCVPADRRARPGGGPSRTTLATGAALAASAAVHDRAAVAPTAAFEAPGEHGLPAPHAAAAETAGGPGPTPAAVRAGPAA